MRSIGVDLGNRPTVCVMEEGKVVQRRTVRELAELSMVLGPGTGHPGRVAIEACREAWVVAAWLEEWGHEVLLVDTTRAKQMGIGQHGRKTDRIDAETLARAVEEDRVPRAHLLSPPRQRWRRELHIRRALVAARATFVTTARGVARMSGVRLPGCEVEQFTGHVEGLALPQELRDGIEPLLLALKELEARIAEVDERLDRLFATDPAHQLLKTAPGTGPIVGAMFISVIDDPNRFQTAHQVEAYLGLVPSEKTSGRRKLGSITKQGNSYLRALLVQAAWSLLRTRGSDPLKLWGREVQKRRGKRIAAIAIARRLAGILWAMWREGTVYEPGRLAEKSAVGFEQQAQSAQLRAWALKRAAAKRLSPAQRAQQRTGAR
jgi:transposase